MDNTSDDSLEESNGAIDITLDDHLPWLSELALRKFDYSDKVFDTCNARAGSVIGFSGLLTAIALPSVKALPGNIRTILFPGWLLAFSVMLYFAWKTYRVTNIQGLPFSMSAMKHLGSLSNVEARKQALVNLVRAAEINEVVNKVKTENLNIAIIFFAIELFILILVIVAST